MPLTPCADLSAARWIMDDDQPWGDLLTIGPAGFPAYARLRYLPDPPSGAPGTDPPEVDGLPEIEQLRMVAAVLARHTGTPDDCYFCLWDGWGSDLDGGAGAFLVDGDCRTRPGPPIAPAFPREVLDGPKVVVPGRAYYLFRGPLSALGDWGAADMWPGQPRLSMPGPAFVWPADRAWCLADDVDPHWAGIAATRSAIADVLQIPHLDLVPSEQGDSPPHYE